MLNAGVYYKGPAPFCDKTTSQHSESCVCLEFVLSFRSGAAAASVFSGGCVWGGGGRTPEQGAGLEQSVLAGGLLIGQPLYRPQTCQSTGTAEPRQEN